MEANTFLSPWYYGTAYFIFYLILTWMTVLYYVGSNRQKVLHSEGSPMQGVALLMTIVITFFLGLRPNAAIFGDMTLYSHTYLNVINGYTPISYHTEWLWDNMMYFCKSVGINITEFYLIVEMGYFFGMFICCLLLMRKDLWIAMLFFCTAFSCYSYGTNGIRNGLSCSIALVGISLLGMGGNKRIGALIILYIAFSIHRSIMLPIAAAFTSLFLIKDTKIALRFWVASIFISLAAGPLIEGFFAALGFDDRMSRYASVNATEATQSQFSRTGFRWDFLFYSMFPVIFTWYLTQHRRFSDRVFNIIANTYLLCNAFWIMVIRSSFSNRFAYLSWFIYPVVIAYPLLRMNIWKDQDRKTALILFFYSGFTFFMFFVYYFGTSTGFNGFNQYWWRKY